MRRGREGFTLVELLVAVVILTTVVLGVGAATSRLAAMAATSAQQATAQDLAEGRLEQVMMDPAYDSLQQRYAGTETTVPDFPGFTRSTQITRTQTTLKGGGMLDYTRATVTVSAPGLTRSVARSVTIAAP